MACVSEASIDLALLRLFRQRDGFSCGSRRLYSELERRWRDTGLRRSDLSRALERLEASGCLKVHHVVPGPDVELLIGGCQRLSPVLARSTEWGRTLRAFLHLWRARVRRSSRSDRPRSGADDRKPPGH